MINDQLVQICRTVVAAVNDAKGLDAVQLRRLFLDIVPQLLTEIDILGNLLQSPFGVADVVVVPEIVAAKKRPAKPKHRKATKAVAIPKKKKPARKTRRR